MTSRPGPAVSRPTCTSWPWHSPPARSRSTHRTGRERHPSTRSCPSRSSGIPGLSCFPLQRYCGGPWGCCQSCAMRPRGSALPPRWHCWGRRCVAQGYDGWWPAATGTRWAGPCCRLALRRIGVDADVVTAVSRYTRRRIASAFGPQAALELLQPGVDCAEFQPDPAARAEIRRRHRVGEAPVVLCVSRLVARKGQDTLVKALPAIRRQVPGARLLLVGDGPQRAALHRLAARCGVADAVVCTGPVPWSELPAHYAAGDVFAMPCRTRGRGLDVEGLGLVFLEAAATGLPVIAGDAGGARETVRIGDTGDLVNGRDVVAVARTVGTLLADPERAAGMGRRGRRWMLQEWSWVCRAQQLEELL